VVDEATQPLFHRVGAVDDAAFNLVGVALAVLVATLWPGIRKPSAEPPPDPGSDRS